MSLKLNLGCSARPPMKGYINIDIDKHPGVDVVRDVSDLSIYKNETVSEIYASHILEHFQHVNTLKVLKEWYRVLEPGSILYLSIPDFERVIEIYKVQGLTDFLNNFMYGGQGHGGDIHYVCFDETRIRNKVIEAGFSEVSRVDNLPTRQVRDCSCLVHQLDLKLVSINLVCIK